VNQRPIVHRFLRLVPGLVLGIVLSPVPPAPAAGSVRVSEADFLAVLEADHLAVEARSGELARAEGALRRAGTLENPWIEFEREAPSDLAEQSTLKLGWTPPLDGRRGLAVDAGEAAVDAARHDLDWARLQLRQEMRAVFAGWAVDQRRRALLARHLESLGALQARLEVRAERGEESRLAARRFALALTGVRARLAESEARLARIRGRALALHPGLPPDAVPLLPDPPAAPSTLGGVEPPDLRARRSEVEVAVLRRRLAGRVLDFPTLMAGWTRISEAGEDFDGPWFGLSWNLPLFDRNQGERHEWSRALAVAEARLELAERERDRRRTAALQAYAALRTSLMEVAGVVEDADEVAAAAGVSFLAGESSMTDLLETLRAVLESQLDALELQARTLAAHRELELSAGRPLTRGDP